MLNIFNKVAAPYAEAILDLGQSNNSLKKTINDMEVILHFLTNSSELKEFLGNPSIARNIKKNAVEDIFGKHISVDTLNLLRLLVDRNRIEILESIVNTFKELVREQDSLKLVELRCAGKLLVRHERILREELKRITGAKKINFTTTVDHRLLAGFTVKVDSLMIDVSLRGRLNRMCSFFGLKVTSN